jgi:hypothetical protein
LDSTVIERALRFPIAEFDDAVTLAAAITSECEYVVTLEPQVFRGSPVRALAPEAALPMLAKE